MSQRIPWSELKFDKDEDGDRVSLGAGAFGTVYSATYSFQLVAVKQVGGGALPPAIVAALEREAALQASPHPPPPSPTPLADPLIKNLRPVLPAARPPNRRPK